MKGNYGKRFLSVMLSVIMVLGMLPVNAFAAEEIVLTSITGPEQTEYTAAVGTALEALGLPEILKATKQNVTQSVSETEVDENGDPLITLSVSTEELDVAVTWNSYDAELTEAQTLTASAKGYTLMEGVKWPTVTVTLTAVEPVVEETTEEEPVETEEIIDEETTEVDADVAAVQAMIEALPEEVTSQEAYDAVYETVYAIDDGGYELTEAQLDALLAARDAADEWYAGEKASDFVENPVEVDTYEELLAALETDNANVKLTANITATATQSSGYGKAGIVLDAGHVLDGAGHKLTINGANSTWDCAIAMRGGEVKNLTVAGAMRGIFMPGANGDVVVENCEFEDVVYTFNSDDGSKDRTVTLKNCKINGWTSFSDAHKSVTFDSCTFGEGNGYAYCRPYQATTFVNCDFAEGYAFDTGSVAGGSKNLEFNDCFYDGEELSAKNDAMFFKGGSVTIDGVVTDVTPPKGNDFTGYTRGDAIWGEVWGNANESFVIKVLDANDNVMGTTSLNNVGGIIDGDVNVTWSLKLDAASNTDEYWTMSWTTAPTIDNMPAKVELWVDGVRVSGGPVVLNGPDEINKIYAAITDDNGKIAGYYTSVAKADEAAKSGDTIALLRNSDEEFELTNKDVKLNKNNYTADGVTEAKPAAKIGENVFYTLADAVAVAQPGDEIVLHKAIAENATLPAGVIFNGNGFAVDGTITAGGDLTIKGITKVTTFNAGYNKPTITIGEGACLETTTGRMVIGHGATFNITGSITDAKTANTADLTPSLIAPGASFTGAGVNFNVTNAYLKFTAYCSSKNNNASGTHDFNVTNSIWEQSGSLVFTEPTNGMDPTFNFELKNSVLNSTSHLVFAVTKGEIVIDNSNVNVDNNKQLENQSTLTIKNGSVVHGAVAISSNAKNPGTLIVEDATYAVTGEFSGSDLGTGTLILREGAIASVEKISKEKAIVKMEPGASLTCETAELAIEVYPGYKVVYENGVYKVVKRVVDHLEGSGTAADPYVVGDLYELLWFAKDVNAGNTYAGKVVKLTADINLAPVVTPFAVDNSNWTPIGTSSTPFQGTFDGNDKTISNLVITGNNSDVGFFGFTTNGEIKNVTFNNATVSGYLDVGVVAGTPYTSKYTNVKVTGHVEVNGYAYVGGVGGKNAYANWTDITVDVDSTSFVKAESENYRTYVGGVVGFNGEGSHTFKNISSNIKVIGSTCDIGGLFGIAHYGNKFEKVTFTGSVEAPAGAEEVGGIAGVWHNQKGTTVTFNKVTSTGTVTIGGVNVTDTMSVVGGAYKASNDTPANSGTLIIDNNKVWPVVAKIGDVEYGDLQAAVEAVKDGETITLLCDVALTGVDNNGWTEGLIYDGDKSFTLDLGGYTITAGSAVNDYLLFFKNNGAKANEITIKNGKIDAGSSAYCALATASTNAQKMTINLEKVELIGNNSNGAVVKPRGGTELNVKAGTKITGIDSYVGIEGVGDNTVVNFYNGAEIYQNGTTSYVGALIGVSNNATANIYGGKGTSAQGGLIVMTSGGTINVSGGEWTANTDGTAAFDNSAVLIAQSAGGASSVIEVTGGTFKGGYNCYGAAAGDAQLAIYGGTFNTEIPAEYCGEGYVPTKMAEGVYGVKANIEAKIGNKGYATLKEAVEKAKAGDTILLQADVALAERLAINKNVTIVDYATYTVSLYGNAGFDIGGGANVTFNNFNIDVSGAVIPGDAMNTVGKDGTAATLNLTDVNVTGDGYSSAFAVFYLYATGNLNITGGEFNLSNDQASAGGFIKANGSAVPKVNITDAKINLTNADIGFVDGTVKLDGVNLTIEGGANAINQSALTVIGSNITVNGANGRALTLSQGDVTIENSTLSFSNCSEGEIRFKKGLTLNVDDQSTLSECHVYADASAVDVANINGETINGVLTSETNPDWTKASTASVAGGTTTVENPDWAAKVEGTNGLVYYMTIADAITAAKPGDTVTILAGDYTGNVSVNKAITVIGETDNEGNNLVNISGKVSISGSGVTVKNLNVQNASGNAMGISGGNILVENCNISGSNGLRNCYANNGDVTLKNCKIVGGTYGVHFDAGNGDGDVIIEGCEITGWTSFGSAIEEVIIKETSFENGAQNKLRLYQNAQLTNVDFNSAMSVDFGKNQVTADFDGCTVDGAESELLDIIYLPDLALMGVDVTVDDEPVIVVAMIGDEDCYLSIDKAFAAVQSGETITLYADVTMQNAYDVKNMTLTIAGEKTLTLNDKLTVSGTSTLNSTAPLSGSVTLNHGATLKDSTINGSVFVAGKVIFSGDNTVAMLYDYGTLTGYYGTVAPMEWSVENGGSLTLTDKARYGLGYGDKVTITGELTDALNARDGLTEDDLSLFMHGLVAQESSGWNCNSSLTVKDAYVTIGSNNSFGNKPGNYGGNYTFNFNNSVLDASRITFYEAVSKTDFTFTGSDVKTGTFMTRDADSVFTLNNTKFVSTSTTNGNDEGNYHAGKLVLNNSELTYSAPMIMENGTIKMDLGSSITAPAVSGTGKIDVDCTGITAANVTVISGDMSGYTGTVTLIGAPEYSYTVNADGLTITKGVAKIDSTVYKTFADALDAVQDGDTITLIGGESTAEQNKEIDFTKDISFTITGTAPKYALPIVTFQNATVTIEDAEILIPELDARQNATINVVDSTVYDAGGNSIVKSYYNGAINISGTSKVYTMQVTTMGYITISDTAVLNATWQTNVYGNGIITVKNGATFNTAALHLTAQDYSGRDNTDADRVGKPAEIVVDGATLVVGKVKSAGGADYSYNSSHGINIGTVEGKNAVLNIKNGAKVNVYMANGETANIGANGTVNVDGSAFTFACRAANGKVTLNNAGTVYVTGTSDIAANVTGAGWVYMNGVNLDADTKLNGAKVGFINGTNAVVGSTIENGFFSVGIGQNAAADAAAVFAAANGITLGDVTVNVSDDAIIGGNGAAYSGWVGSAYSADKTKYEYVLNVVDSMAAFGYMHVSKDGELNVTGHATNKYTYDNANVDFYAGDLIINGAVTLDGTDAWVKYTKVSVDHADGVLNITNGTNYESSIHNGSNTSTSLKFWQAGKINVDKTSKVEIDNGTVLTDGAELNIAGTVTAKGEVTGNGTITLTAEGATLTAADGLTVVTTEALKDFKVVYTDGAYKLIAKAYVAQVNGEAKFELLAKAIEAAQPNDTIVLLDAVNENVTVNKNITIDGAEKNYTGTMTVSNGKTVTVENVNFVKGCVDKAKGTSGTLTIKNCDFDGVDNSINYAVTMRGGNAVTMEGCTVKNYDYGMLYIPSAVTNVTVKDTTVENVNYGVHVAYGQNVTLDNVKMINVAYGIMTQNYGAKTITIKNCELSGTNPIYVWERNTTVVDTFNFEGANTVSALPTSAQAKLVLAVTDATLKAPANADVTTSVENHVVVYNDGVYSVAKAVAQVGETKYASLQAAINAAQNGETVVLMKDIDITGMATGDLDGLKTLFVVDNKTITVDLNGKTISGAYTDATTLLVSVFLTDNNGHLTLKNGTVDITGGDMTDTKYASNIYSLIANYEEGCSITIESGTYKLNKAHDCLLYTGGDEGIIINDGTFELGNVGDGTNGKPWIFNALGQNAGHVVVNGGTFNADVNHQFWANEVFVPETKALKAENGTWTVVDAVAYAVEKAKSTYSTARNIGYATLAEAVAAKTEVIYLLDDNAENITVTKTLTIYRTEDRFYADGVKAGDGCKMTETKEAYSFAMLTDAAAEINGVKYDTVAEALAAAKSGDTVMLMKASEESMVMIKSGVKLDLNGNTLTAGYVVALNGSDVIDNSANNAGLLKTEYISLAENNSQLPVWTGEGYQFFEITLLKRLTPSEDSAKFQFQIKRTDDSDRLMNLLRDNGAEDHKLSIMVKISWATEQGMAHQYYTYNSKMVMENAEGQMTTSQVGTYNCTLTGISGRTDIEFAAVIGTECGVELSSVSVKVQ